MFFDFSCSNIFDGLRRLLRERAGGVAVTMALSTIPAIGLVGGTLDVYRMYDLRAKLTAAADAAVLSATSKAALSMTAAQASTKSDTTFKGELSTDQKAALLTAQPSVTDDGTTRTAAYSWQANVATPFLGILGTTTTVVAGSTQASAALPVYMDFYLLLDNTPSMGVGATNADIAKMVANTSDQCAFACHDMSTTPNDYYGLAKKLGVTMRIDVVRSATQQLMDTAASAQAVTNQFRMAIYTFGSSASATGLTTIAALTGNLSSAKTSAAAIDLMTSPYQNYNSDMDTDFNKILTSVNGAIPNPGSGNSASATPQKVLFIVSDGVADYKNTSSCTQTPYAGYRCEEALNPSYCATIKNRGVKIAVLYTTYLPLPTNGWYMSQIAPFSAQISANMKSCASPGLYFEVSPTDGIADAMNALFKAALQTARITQ
ncbi:MAG: pilus assembly protein TadG-related protein [Hyphomicrobiales bacterium]|nr:pilus assembly protein TadG-related protein [Hyphomicrobiales bacterium]